MEEPLEPSLRVLACDMSALTPDQRARHTVATQRLIAMGTREELPDGFRFNISREAMSPADLAEWVADESRCCPAVDFRIDPPADGTLTLHIGGDAAVKEFIAAELGLSLANGESGQGENHDPADADR